MPWHRRSAEDEKLKGVFIVALTGYAQPEDLGRVAEAGFDRHVAKPVEMETLERDAGVKLKSVESCTF